MEVVLIVALALSLVLLLLAVNTLWLCVVSAGVMQMKRDEQPAPIAPEVNLCVVTPPAIEGFLRQFLPVGYSLSVTRDEDKLKWQYSTPDDDDLVTWCEGDLADVMGEIQAKHTGDDEHAP